MKTTKISAVTLAAGLLAGSAYATTATGPAALDWLPPSTALLLEVPHAASTVEMYEASDFASAFDFRQVERLIVARDEFPFQSLAHLVAEWTSLTPEQAQFRNLLPDGPLVAGLFPWSEVRSNNDSVATTSGSDQVEMEWMVVVTCASHDHANILIQDAPNLFLRDADDSSVSSHLSASVEIEGRAALQYTARTDDADAKSSEIHDESPGSPFYAMANGTQAVFSSERQAIRDALIRSASGKPGLAESPTMSRVSASVPASDLRLTFFPSGFSHVVATGSSETAWLRTFVNNWLNFVGPVSALSVSAGFVEPASKAGDGDDSVAKEPLLQFDAAMLMPEGRTGLADLFSQSSAIGDLPIIDIDPATTSLGRLNIALDLVPDLVAQGFDAYRKSGRVPAEQTVATLTQLGDALPITFGDTLRFWNVAELRPTNQVQLERAWRIGLDDPEAVSPYLGLVHRMRGLTRAPYRGAIVFDVTEHPDKISGRTDSVQLWEDRWMYGDQNLVHRMLDRYRDSEAAQFDPDPLVAPVNALVGDVPVVGWAFLNTETVQLADFTIIQSLFTPALSRARRNADLLRAEAEGVEPPPEAESEVAADFDFVAILEIFGVLNRDAFRRAIGDAVLWLLSTDDGFEFRARMFPSS